MVVSILDVYNDDAFVVLMSTMAVMELMVTVQVPDDSIQPFLVKKHFAYVIVVVSQSDPTQLSFQIFRDRSVMKNFSNHST